MNKFSRFLALLILSLFLSGPLPAQNVSMVSASDLENFHQVLKLWGQKDLIPLRGTWEMFRDDGSDKVYLICAKKKGGVAKVTITYPPQRGNVKPKPIIEVDR